MKMTNFKLSRDELKYTRNIIFLALILNLIIEVLNTNSIVDTLSYIIHRPHIFLYNTFIILFTLSVTLLTKRRLVTCSAISIIWLAFGITNNILLKFRTTPFTAVDIKLMSEAFPIMDKYLTHFQIILLAILIVLVLVGLVFAFLKLPKHKSKINYLSNGLVVALILTFTLIFTSFGMKTNILAKNFGNIGDAFKDYGFAYCFTNSLINTGIDKPRNYSEEVIQDIVEATEETLAPETTTVTNMVDDKTDEPVIKEAKSPNIIFLQLESFFDPTLVHGFTFSSDPIPNFHSLEKNYTSGYLSVPSVGAGTANTEFEVISGMNLDFFGPGEYPYKTILKETTCESMAYDLKSLDYHTHAIHNNTATFYGRNKVFPNLGFDSFTSIEYMDNIEYNPLGWAKDDVLVNEIMNVLNSTEGKDYIYTISVQGHGKYPKDVESLYNGAISEGIDGDFREEPTGSIEVFQPLITPSLGSDEGDDSSSLQENAPTTDLGGYISEHAITMEGIDKERKYAFEYYVNQIHEMDAFIGKLVEQLENYDEDVILVMYGDHLPSLGIEEEDLINKDIYQTQYIIWSSKGVIEGQHDKDIEAYQLSAYALSLINQNPGILTKLHQKELASSTTDDAELTSDSEKYTNVSASNLSTPLATATATDSDTNDSNHTDITTTIPYLDELKLLQYDMLYGKQECFDKINPYLPTELQLGVLPIRIDTIEQANDELLLHGQHFTPFSKIIINDEEVTTTFIDSSTLSCKAPTADADTIVSVAQITEEGTELSRTSAYKMN